MLFPTVRFALFFAVVLPANWLLMPRRGLWRVFIVAASFFFYANWDAGYTFLLAGSILGNHAGARWIDRARGGLRQQRLAIVVGTNLGVLAWYKYAGFLASNARSLTDWVGLDWQLSAPNVLLPIGISFFTFQALSYVVDVYRGRVEPVTFQDFAVYLSFFPHLVAGPIVRAAEFVPQLRHRRDPRRVDATLGFWLIAVGLFKKVVVASYLAEEAVDPLFGFPDQHGGFEALVGVYAYAIQIYADFSGYTDMAIGLALLLGFRFPVNFDAPYSATSITDFWRRWHLTLSRWLRDYLYVPLGGNRGGGWRTYRNLILTMVLGGLWHGAAWTFVLWGTLHGVGLATERTLSGRPRRAGPAAPPPPPEAGAPVGVSVGVASGVPSSDSPSDSRPIGLENAGETRGGVAETQSEAEVDEDEAGVPVFVVQGAHGFSLRSWVGRIVTFHFVCLGWILFRSGSVEQAQDVLERILFHGGPSVNKVVVLVVLAMLAAQFVPAEAVRRAQARVSRWSVLAQAAALAGVLVAVDALGPTGVPPFIYFQF